MSEPTGAPAHPFIIPNDPATTANRTEKGQLISSTSAELTKPLFFGPAPKLEVEASRNKGISTAKNLREFITGILRLFSSQNSAGTSCDQSSGRPKKGKWKLKELVSIPPILAGYFGM